VQGATTKWLLVVLLAVIAACLLVEVGASVSAADSGGTAAATSGGAGPLFAVAGQISKDTYGLYLVDTQNATICLYEWLPQNRKLRLLAARSIRWDRQLQEYNTEIPPSEVEKLVSNQRPGG